MSTANVLRNFLMTTLSIKWSYYNIRPHPLREFSVLIVCIVFLSSFHLASLLFVIIETVEFLTLHLQKMETFLLTIEPLFFGPQRCCYFHRLSALWTLTLKEWFLLTKIYIKIRFRFHTFEHFILTDCYIVSCCQPK